MKNIAIIDDYDLMAETVYDFIEDILDDLDKSDEFKISTYSDARVALGELGSGDIVISDIDMSGKMNGLDFAEGAKQEGINVILSSGNPEYKDRVSGKFPFLSKPYLYEDISNLIIPYLNGGSDE